MKHFYIFICIILSINCLAQKNLPIIKATSKSAMIIEDARLKVRWNLSPETKPDVFITSKLTKPTKVKLITDIDSISLVVKPGQHKDFVVLLNGQDSCYTRFSSPEIKDYKNVVPVINDTIPLVLNKYNTAYVKVIINKVDTLNLNFDTGATELTLLEETLKTKVKGNIALYNTIYDVQIGSRIYKTNINDTQLAGHETDGIFGWNIFDGLIVELNYDKGYMVVHSKLPKNIQRNKAYTSLPIKYFNHRFFIEANIVQNGSKVKDWFLFDSGYQKTVMLDNDLLLQQSFSTDQMEFINKVVMRGTTGQEVPVTTAKLQSLKIGKFELSNVPAQVMTGNKTLFGTNIHILGNDVLKRFTTYLDFQENIVYLKPNNLYDAEY